MTCCVLTDLKQLDLVTLIPPVMDIGDDELECLDFEEEEELLWTPINRYDEFPLLDHLP